MILVHRTAHTTYNFSKKRPDAKIACIGFTGSGRPFHWPYQFPWAD